MDNNTDTNKNKYNYNSNNKNYYNIATLNEGNTMRRMYRRIQRSVCWKLGTISVHI